MESEDIIQEAAPVETPAEQEPSQSSLARIEAAISEVREALAAVSERIDALEAAAGVTAKQVGYLPPQVRMLTGKIEGLAATISEPRYRALLLNLLGIYDLVDQVIRSADGADAAHMRNYEVLRTQLCQVLEINGLSEIPADGAFNAEIHRAVERVNVEDPEEGNRVLGVVRPGFRTEQSVLRYAEVRVGYFRPQPAEERSAEMIDKKETE